MTNNKSEFTNILKKCLDNFKTHPLLIKLEKNTFTMDDYHTYLINILHQTLNGPLTFAIAGSNCDIQFVNIREYLIKHAEEEMNHWKWVVSDLQNTNYPGNNYLEKHPPIETQAYVAYNYYAAYKKPISRLGIAAILESIGATYGKFAAQKIQKNLKLNEKQISFLYGHGDTDVGHTEEILELLDKSNLDNQQWGDLVNAVNVGYNLYSRMLSQTSHE